MGRLYARLGVHVARRFVAGGPFWTARHARRAAQRRRLLPGTRSARRYLRQSVVVEAPHGASSAALLAVTLAEWRAGRIGSGTLWLLGNVVVDRYPVLVQRYDRAWITRVLARAGTHPDAPAARRGVAPDTAAR